MTISKYIKDLQDDNSRLSKESILRNAAAMAESMNTADEENLFKIFYYAYNPYITFGIRQVPDWDGSDDETNPWDEFFVLLSRLHTRTLSGNAAKSAVVSMSRQFSQTEWDNVAAPCIRRDMRCGVSSATVNKILGKTMLGKRWMIPEFGCQLATNCTGRPEMTGHKRIEAKLDGVRTLLLVRPGGACSLSRNGKEYENYGEIESVVHAAFDKIVSQHSFLYNGFVLDGEVTGVDFQDLMSAARRKKNKKDYKFVFNVFDIIPIEDFFVGKCDLPQGPRSNLLTNVINLIGDRNTVKAVEYINVDLDTAQGKDAFERYCKDLVEAGYEGAIIKDLSAPYVCDRGTNWLKYKPVYDYDLVATKIEPGNGKHAGKMGAILFEGTDGASGATISVSVGSGYTDEQRKEWFDNPELVLGKTGVVFADMVTKANEDGVSSLRFPRFSGIWRTDK